MSSKILLHINSSSRYKESITRQVSTSLVALLKQKHSSLAVVSRDTATGLPFVNEAWIEANFTNAENRNERHEQELSLSDELVSELQDADILVIGVPIYNFNIPSPLKAWVDLVARVGLTFRYTEKGPVGLLENKKVYVVMASGGVPIGSEMDLASAYLKVVFNFVGLHDLTIIDSSMLDDLNDSEAVTSQLSSLITE